MEPKQSKGAVFTCPWLPFLQDCSAEAGDPIHGACSGQHRVEVSRVNPHPQRGGIQKVFVQRQHAIMVEVIVQHITALVPQATLLHMSVNRRLNIRAIQVVTSVFVNARRYHDFLREFEQRDVRNEAMALCDNASSVIQANVVENVIRIDLAQKLLRLSHGILTLLVWRKWAKVPFAGCQRRSILCR